MRALQKEENCLREKLLAPHQPPAQALAEHDQVVEHAFLDVPEEQHCCEMLREGRAGLITRLESALRQGARVQVDASRRHDDGGGRSLGGWGRGVLGHASVLPLLPSRARRLDTCSKNVSPGVRISRIAHAGACFGCGIRSYAEPRVGGLMRGKRPPIVYMWSAGFDP